jgi:hypothetical protein
MSKRNGYQPRYVSMAAQDHEQAISPELRAQVDALADRLVSEYEDRKHSMYDLLKRHPQDERFKETWTPERIEEYASGTDDTTAIERMRSRSFYEITYQDLQSATNQDPKQTLMVLGAMSDAAKDRVEGGIFAADVLGFTMPYERLEFAVIRNGFIDEWQPRGGIEASLVDMLTQTYLAWQFWLKRSFDVATNQDLAAQQVARSKTPYDSGTWQPPRVTAKEWLDHSTQMADRFNRMFLRVLRQMRDLRRYASPVVIQNAEQVNVAADGGQQINVQKKQKGKKAKPARPAIRLARKQ